MSHIQRLLHPFSKCQHMVCLCADGRQSIVYEREITTPKIKTSDMSSNGNHYRSLNMSSGIIIVHQLLGKRKKVLCENGVCIRVLMNDSVQMLIDFSAKRKVSE